MNSSGAVDIALTRLNTSCMCCDPMKSFTALTSDAAVPAQAKPAAQVMPSAASTPPRLSIAVLPFANIGGDPEQEYFVDGVTESLTTDLSRISGSFVIARNTAYTFKGKAVGVKQIGRELGVRYLLEGS